jgi:predicted phosphodiesterase
MDRIALVADIHGNLPALEAVDADIAAHGIGRVCNLGDHVSGPLWPRETADFLMRRPWITIRGNHDRQVAFDDPATLGPSDRHAHERLTAEQKEWLTKMPATATLSDDRVFLCHGTPADDRQYFLETVESERFRLASPEEISTRLGGVEAMLVACGHSHVPRLVHEARGIPVVNPGSVGVPAFSVGGESPHVSETGSPEARYAIVEIEGRAVRVVFVAIGYDFESAARRAETNGRPEWGGALRTGHARRGA